MKEIEWRSSANLLSILSGEVHSDLKSPPIRRSINCISSQIGKDFTKNNDLLEDGGR